MKTHRRPGFDAGISPRFAPASHLFRVHLQKGGGLNKRERVHRLPSTRERGATTTKKGLLGEDLRRARCSAAVLTAAEATVAACSMAQA